MYLDEPNDFEKAQEYLESGKALHYIPAYRESELLRLLEDYFWERSNDGAPAISAEKWFAIATLVTGCDSLVATQN